MTPPSHRQALLRLFREHGDYLNTAQVTAAGIPRTELARLAERGEITRVARGVYRLADPTGGERGAPDPLTRLLEVHLRFPYARPCLLSALHLHGLAQPPDVPQFAVPANRQAVVFGEEATETVFLRGKAYASGLTTVEVGGRALTTYTAEKSLVHLLRFAARFGSEMPRAALGRYLQRPGADHAALAHWAEELGARRALERERAALAAVAGR